MSKYLIQDIIPPEKKRRNALRGGAKKSTNEEHVITHPEHPIVQGSPITRMPISKAFPENPRSMIADQIAHDETEHEEAENEKMHETHHSVVSESSPATSGRFAKMITPEKRGWSYDQLHTEEEPALPAALASAPPPEKPPRFPEYRVTESGNGGRRMGAWLPWLLGSVVVTVAGVLLLNFFAGATVTIVPKQETLPIDEKFSALKNGSAADLSYALMIATSSSALEVSATGEKTVTTKASGRIVIYNEQTVPQRLIKNTRFQSPGGKIYRINDSITVPKGILTSGKLTPGSLEVTVYADEAGPEYNSDPVDFTLPGLKTSPLFTKVYARSKGPLAGGASGTIKTVSDQDLKQAGEDLRVELETKLRSKARGDLAPFQIVYDHGIMVELGTPLLSKAPASASNKAVVSLEGKITLVLFKRADLTKAIAKKLVQNYAGEEVLINNLETLQFAMSPQGGTTLANGTKLDFTLKGTPELTWVIDEAAIKKALVGISKESFIGILAQYPSVERAQASVRPMWKRSFPDDPNKISVVLTTQ